MTVPLVTNTALSRMPCVAARKFGGRVFADFLGRQYSYLELALAARRYAAMFAEAGLQPGDRVALVMPNCPYYPAAFYGALQAGGVVVNVNPAGSPKETAFVLKDSGARFVFTVNLRLITDMLQQAMKLEACLDTQIDTVFTADFPGALTSGKGIMLRMLRPKSLLLKPLCRDKRFRFLSGYARDEQGKETSCGDDAAAPPPPYDKSEDGKKLALLQYTGGTTGRPKGAEITHAALYANGVQCASRMAGCGESAETVAGLLPFFHIFALTAVMQVSVFNGYKIIMYPRPDIPLLLQDIGLKEITILPGVPALFAKMLDHPQFSRSVLTSLRFCVSGGAPMPLALLERFEKEASTVIAEGYGLTEASPVLAFNRPRKEDRLPGSAGKPLKDTVIDIVPLDSDDGDNLPAGEIGEIRASGPQIMRCYAGAAADDGVFDARGRLRTGDAGFLDENGFLHIVDRYKEMLIVSGFNVYPRETEEALLSYPGISECAVIGAPDSKKGDKVIAAIVLQKDGAYDEQELRAFLKERLTYYKIPSRIHVTGALPKTSVGKPDKKALREMLAVHA